MDRYKCPVGKWGVDIRVKYDVDITKAFAVLRRDDSMSNCDASKSESGNSRSDAAESKCDGGDSKGDTELETETETDVE